MSKSEYLALLEKAPKKPIKTSYQTRLQQFYKEFNPQKRIQATGWVPAR